MLLGGSPAAHHPGGGCRLTLGGIRTPGSRSGSRPPCGGLPLRLGGLPPPRRCLRLAASNSGREPGWDEWDAEGDLVAQAASTAPDAASWGPLHQELRSRWQRQQPRQAMQPPQQQQQQQAGGRQAEASTAAATPAPAAGSSVYSLGVAAAPRRAAASHAIRPLPPPPSGMEARYFTLGAVAAVLLHYLVNFTGTLPVVRGLVQRFVWWREPQQAAPPLGAGDGSSGGGGGGGTSGGTTGLAMQYSEDEESVEWVNMCWRKAWRVYQRGIERWLADLLQPLFDSLVEQKMVPSFVQRLRIMEFTLDHEAPYFTNMRRRTSRKDSDLNGVVDVRYTGGARMLLLIEVGTGRWRIKIPVMVSDLDLESKLWLKIRLAPMCPWIGTLGLGFVGAPSIKVQLNPYNRIRLMKIPILQAFLTRFFTKDLPALITLPQRLEINIPPAVTAVAEAAVGRDAVMRAVASAVLQADALEHALLAALPLGPQGAAGGVSLPDLFQGELQVTLHEARDLPVWGFPWQSNPYCRITLGSQAVQSRREDDTSHAGRHRAPVWNQDFQFLVEDPSAQALDIWIGDSPMTGRTEVGRAVFPLRQLASDGTADVWLPVESSMPGEHTQGAVRLLLSYKPFQEDEVDSGYRAAAAFGGLGQQSSAEITDVKSAADASSRAAVAASAAAAAVAVTKAAAARAAARIARTAQQQAAKAQEPRQPEEAAAAQRAAGSRDGNGDGEVELPLPAITAVSPQGSQALLPAGSTAQSHPGAEAAPEGDGRAVAAAAAAAAAPDAAVAAAAAAAAAAGAPGANGASSGGHAVNIAGGDDTSSNGSGTRRTLSTVEQLTTMAATMQQLTAEVDGIVHSSGTLSGTGGALSTLSMDAEVKVAAVEAVAAAEAAAISAVAAGDLTGANRVLREAAAALHSTVAQLAAAEGGAAAVDAAAAAAAAAAAQPASPGSQAAAQALARAEEALAAAHAAAAQAADAAAVAQAASAAMDARGPPPGSSDDEEEESDLEAAAVAAAGLDAAPAAEAAEQRSLGLPSYDSEPEAPRGTAWWLAATQFVPGVPRQGDRAAAEGTAAEADGGAGVAPLPGAPPPPSSSSKPAASAGPATGTSSKRGASSSTSGGSDGSGGGSEAAAGGPVADVVIPADLPLEEITAEVLKSWKLRDTHVETLVQKAMEARRKQAERPWVQLLALASCASAVLLVALLYRVQHMP